MLEGYIEEREREDILTRKRERTNSFDQAEVECEKIQKRRQESIELPNDHIVESIRDCITKTHLKLDLWSFVLMENNRTPEIGVSDLF